MQGKVQNVLVFKIDRLTRNTKDLISLMELFKENNCGFNSLMDVMDRLADTICSLTHDVIKSITGRNWILSMF